MYKISKKPIPKNTTKGRPEKYYLHEMKVGECREYTEFEMDGAIVPVNEDTVYNLRGGLFSSASLYKVKIVTQYKDGALLVWRKK